MTRVLEKAAETGKVLVMVFLEGGNDGLNTVVPLDRLSELASLRKNVFLDERQLLTLRDQPVAFHPMMTELREMFFDNRLQIVQNVGYPEPNFSHFRSTDIWMSASDSTTHVPTGWVGRYLDDRFSEYPENYPNDDMPDPLSVEIGFGSSLLFQGFSTVKNVTINSVDSFYDLVDDIEQVAPDSRAGEKLKYIRFISRQSQVYSQRISELASRVTNQREYPENNELADQLKIVAKLIAAGSRTPLYFVKLNGFDTHDSQVDPTNHVDGEHGLLLKRFNDAVHVFQNDLDEQGKSDQVLGMAFSEFGRTIVSNASGGTDHGTAGPVFFFGNAVKGGIMGSNPNIDKEMTYKDNLPFEYDFRQLYGSVLEQWFGVQETQRSRYLLRDFATVPIIGDKVDLSLKEKGEVLFAYPNPVSDLTRIGVHVKGGPTSIELIDSSGRLLEKVFSGAFPQGYSEITWSTSNLEPGHYHLRLNTRGNSHTFSILKSP